jgi:hypothetical protein
MVLKKVFGPKGQKVTGDWRKLRNEALHDLYCSTDIVRAVKSRMMKRQGHVATTREDKRKQGFGKENSRKETTWKTQV